jgi:hypothetical protein
MGIFVMAQLAVAAIRSKGFASKHMGRSEVDRPVIRLGKSI